MTNRAQAEVSIAEAYIANEALRFCSMYHRAIVNQEDTQINDDAIVTLDDTQTRPSMPIFSQSAQPFGPQDSVKLSVEELEDLKILVLL